MLPPIEKRKILTKENFHFIKNHKSYAFVKFLPQIFFSTSSQFSVSRPSEAGVVELFLGEAYVNVEVHGFCALPCQSTNFSVGFNLARDKFLANQDWVLF